MLNTRQATLAVAAFEEVDKKLPKSTPVDIFIAQVVTLLCREHTDDFNSKIAKEIEQIVLAIGCIKKCKIPKPASCLVKHSGFCWDSLVKLSDLMGYELVEVSVVTELYIIG